MNSKLLTIPLKDYLTDITDQERDIIQQEKKYYEIAITLKNKRESLGLTQQELAKKAELPRATVTKVESGNRNTTLKTLTAMAQAMGSNLELRLR